MWFYLVVWVVCESEGFRAATAAIRSVCVSHGIVLKAKNNHKNALSRNLRAELVLAEMNIAGFIEFSGAESDKA